MPKYAFTKVKTGSFLLLLLLLLYPERGTVSELYHNRDIYIFEFSQDHVTKNQPVAVPV